MSKRPGFVVHCEDGKIGRTYHDEKRIDGKIKVHIIADNLAHLFSKDYKQPTDPPRLCDPLKLIISGMAD